VLQPSYRHQRHQRTPPQEKKVHPGSSQKVSTPPLSFFPVSHGCFARFFYRVFWAFRNKGEFKNAIKNKSRFFPQSPKKTLTYLRHFLLFSFPIAPLGVLLSLYTTTPNAYVVFGRGFHYRYRLSARQYATYICLACTNGTKHQGTKGHWVLGIYAGTRRWQWQLVRRRRSSLPPRSRSGS
jgi:hypothetical protein